MKKLTRTLKSTQAVVLAVNEHGGDVAEFTTIVPGTYKDSKKLLKAAVVPQGYTPIYVKSQTIILKKYVITEEAFIANAVAVD